METRERQAMYRMSVVRVIVRDMRIYMVLFGLAIAPLVKQK